MCVGGGGSCVFFMEAVCSRVVCGWRGLGGVVGSFTLGRCLSLWVMLR
jgi:hypothetical protein